MRAVHFAVVIGITAIASFAVGTYYGKHQGEATTRAQWMDRETSLKGIELHKDLSTLLALREQPGQKLAPDLELWVTERIKGLDLDSVAPGSASSAVLRETANKLVEYRTKHPATAIDPGTDPKVKQLLTFAGKSALPSNNTVETDARKSGARGSP